jgi:hypothetical protein
MTFYRNRDFLLEVARGRIAKHAFVRILGINPDIDTASEEDVVAFGGDQPWFASAQSLEAISSNANDTNSSGTGARSIRITGLNGSHAPITEDVNLNGTGAVALSNTYIGDVRAKLLTSGSGFTNDGTVGIRIASGGATVASMPPGFGQTLAAVYTVPAGKTAYVVGWFTSLYKAVTSTHAELRLMVYDDTVGWRLEALHELDEGGAAINSRHSEGLLVKLPAKSSIRVRAKVSVNDTGVSSELALVLIDN